MKKHKYTKTMTFNIPQIHAVSKKLIKLQAIPYEKIEHCLKLTYPSNVNTEQLDLNAYKSRKYRIFNIKIEAFNKDWIFTSPEAFPHISSDFFEQ